MSSGGALLLADVVVFALIVWAVHLALGWLLGPLAVVVGVFLLLWLLLRS